MSFRKAIFGVLVGATAMLWSGSVDAHKAYVPDVSAPAEQTCPNDIVVWVNTNSGIYHLPGMRWYGRTAAGKYTHVRRLLIRPDTAPRTTISSSI
jgi:hypothetical protein